MAHSLPKLSVVIPIYNEELAIRENVTILVGALNDIQRGGKNGVVIREWELVLVNDGSTDKTLDIIQEEAQKESRIKIASYKTNRGRGHALKTGFKTATGDYIVVTESDLNWGSEIIGQFVVALEGEDVDIVIASPHMKGGGMENVPFFRWALSHFGNKVFSIALPGKFTMVTGMTRAYRREVLESLDLESEDKELHVEIIYKSLDLGFRIIEIPAMLRWKKPVPGVEIRKSHFKPTQIVKHLAMSFFIRPFMLFGTVGLTLLGLGIAMGVYLLILSSSGTPVVGRPMLFAAVLFIIIGFQVLLFGFLANQNRNLKRQLSRVQRDINRRRS
ncbi:MAG: glycosyltransferase family 2 protein [bacterium]|nr:glycosyltransferase family 2 protein [bacterium]